MAASNGPLSRVMDGIPILCDERRRLAEYRIPSVAAVPS
jgi:hypothetical protein